MDRGRVIADFDGVTESLSKSFILITERSKMRVGIKRMTKVKTWLSTHVTPKRSAEVDCGNEGSHRLLPNP
ncbi:hypothetical protein SAMN06298226_1752 [Nitrosovibrio sp. Nv4]|nr:hypothetical protein SAMN06298226_1752 [Nitrosovibrio sp. Nv4]